MNASTRQVRDVATVELEGVAAPASDLREATQADKRRSVRHEAGEHEGVHRGLGRLDRRAEQLDGRGWVRAHERARQAPRELKRNGREASTAQGQGHERGVAGVARQHQRLSAAREGPARGEYPRR